MKHKKEAIGFITSFLITYMAMKTFGFVGVFIAVLLIFLIASRLDGKE